MSIVGGQSKHKSKNFNLLISVTLKTNVLQTILFHIFTLRVCKTLKQHKNRTSCRYNQTVARRKNTQRTLIQVFIIKQ